MTKEKFFGSIQYRMKVLFFINLIILIIIYFDEMDDFFNHDIGMEKVRSIALILITSIMFLLSAGIMINLKKWADFYIK
jgi:hypothetical protein